MRGEVDALDFILAEQWGCTLAEVRAMPSSEIEDWRAWRTIKVELMRIQGAPRGVR